MAIACKAASGTSRRPPSRSSLLDRPHRPAGVGCCCSGPRWGAPTWLQLACDCSRRRWSAVTFTVRSEILRLACSSSSSLSLMLPSTSPCSAAGAGGGGGCGGVHACRPGGKAPACTGEDIFRATRRACVPSPSCPSAPPVHHPGNSTQGLPAPRPPPRPPTMLLCSLSCRPAARAAEAATSSRASSLARLSAARPSRA